MDKELETLISKAAKAAAKADAEDGGYRNAGKMLSIITKASHARSIGQTKEEFKKRLTPDERDYLGW